MFKIRPAAASDWSAIWRMIEPVFRAGETYPTDPDVTEAGAHRYWIEQPMGTFVMVDSAENILGSYYIKPNQPTLGAHVCNCGYIVAENARGQGVASQLCIHSQQIAVELGFRAMQYNLVVSTNTVAFRLWKKHGFQVVGTLPQAFKHSKLGYVDAYVLYKLL